MKPNASWRSDDALSCVKTLLRRDPLARPSAEEALQMSWMTSSMSGFGPASIDLPPSLRPMLHAARKAGVFEVRDLVPSGKVDDCLNSLQKVRLGRPLPVTPACQFDSSLAIQ